MMATPINRGAWPWMIKIRFPLRRQNVDLGTKGSLQEPRTQTLLAPSFCAGTPSESFEATAAFMLWGANEPDTKARATDGV
jgi:hypothetical protein